ncbi:hypothetical protein A7K93_06485 [Candidatus Methylacidiphilum fumarolicum]|nr:hypothetical protein A7K73_07645 [Candidatus Methylacidiphilum fumarolicum]TFE73221.1 hypothetical protein A7K93_06485 [Candidatus Methylacidiphilum fumarolicum]TFE73248.1 hypothetical protein A7K72_06910 [Candidatus Methylacidiphilum fumarolicum]TFE76494.1 hypothetical protein A7D33_09865 [Candidatus Methylacidiphilum fumarolicum]
MTRRDGMACRMFTSPKSGGGKKFCQSRTIEGTFGKLWNMTEWVLIVLFPDGDRRAEAFLPINVGCGERAGNGTFFCVVGRLVCLGTGMVPAG